MKRLYLLSVLVTVFTGCYITYAAGSYGRIFWHMLDTQDLSAAWLMLGLLLFVALFYHSRYSQADWFIKILLGLDSHRYIIATILFGVLCIGSLVVYSDTPLCMDEYAAVFQARVFAAGEMHGQFPIDIMDYCIPKGSQNFFLMINPVDGSVISTYWPGFSLLLAPFALLNIPWAFNPLITVASLLLIREVTYKLVPSKYSTGWALLFALSSPVFLAYGISYYSWSSHLFFNLLFVWLLTANTRSCFILAGLVGGYAMILHNPPPHILFALPWIYWVWKRKGVNIVWMAVGYIPVVAILGVGWTLYTQHLIRAGEGATAQVSSHLVSYASPLQYLGELLHLPGYDMCKARIGAISKLWLWGCPLIIPLACWGAWRSRSVELRLMALSAIFTFVGYLFIQLDQGHGWGYRFFHSAWGVLPVLAAAAVCRESAIGRLSYRWSAAIVLVALMSLFIMNGLRAKQITHFITAHLAQRPPMIGDHLRDGAKFSKQLVLHNGSGYYALDLVQNDPWLNGNTIILFAPNQAHEKALVDRFMPKGILFGRNWYGATYVERSAEPNVVRPGE